MEDRTVHAPGLGTDRVAREQLEFTGRRRRRIMLAAAAGNFAEWYDWGVYGVVATIISAQFFPGGDPAVALLNTYAVFALGYLSRPLGGIVFGRIGDKYGRRRALSLTILLTCGGTAAMGVLPTHAAIGFLAPVLLLVARLAQSMGAGGEYASAIGFVYEHSPQARRSTNVSQLVATTFVGIMVGSLLARAATAVMGQEAFESYGWRLLFLLGLPLAVAGVWLRRRVEETPEFTQLARERADTAQSSTPLRDAFGSQWVTMLLFVLATASYALISTTITSYLTTFLRGVGSLSATQAYNATIVSNVAVIGVTLLAGLLCDRIGLRRTFTVAGVVVAVTAVPAFALAAAGPTGGILGSALIGACKGLLAVPALLALSQLFPAAVRLTAGALAYNVVQGLFGGTGPIIGVWLNDVTGSSRGFALYLAALCLVTVVVSLLARRTLDRRPALQAPAPTPNAQVAA